jgi:uncharacterized protein YqgC (DUF456 family)
MAGETKEDEEKGLTNFEAWLGLVGGVIVFFFLCYLMYELGHSEIDLRVFTLFYFCALTIITCIAALSDNSKNDKIGPGEAKSKLAQHIALIGLVVYLVIFLIVFGLMMNEVKKILSQPIEPMKIRTRRNM